MSSTGLQGLSRVLLLVGGIVALVGGIVALVGGFLGLAAGFVGAGSPLAIILGIASLYYYGRLNSEGVVVVLLVLGLILAGITGGVASFGGILVSVAALVSLVVRYTKS